MAIGIRKIEFKIGSSSSSRSSSGGGQAPPPPLSGSGIRSAAPPLAREGPSSSKQKAIPSHLPLPAPAPPGIPFVDPPWRTGSPPQPRPKLPLAQSVPPSDHFAPTGTDTVSSSFLCCLGLRTYGRVLEPLSV
jgi:hypothetical protein